MVRDQLNLKSWIDTFKVGKYGIILDLKQGNTHGSNIFLFANKNFELNNIQRYSNVNHYTSIYLTTIEKLELSKILIEPTSMIELHAILSKNFKSYLHPWVLLFGWDGDVV